MADYKSTHTGEQIDTAIDNANSNWSLLMNNLGIGRWRNQDFFTDYESSNSIYDSMLPQYYNYSYCFANVGFIDERTGQYNNKPTVMANGFSFTKSTSAQPWDRKKMIGVFFGWKNASALTIKLNASDENLISNFHYVFNCGQMTSINVENGILKPTYVYLPFHNCPNLISIDGIDMSNQLSSAFGLTGCPKVKHLGITHWKLSFNIAGSTAFEEADLVEIISNLDAVTTAQTLTMGATNLAKLTDAEKQVATDKGWVLA